MAKNNDFQSRLYLAGVCDDEGAQINLALLRDDLIITELCKNKNLSIRTQYYIVNSANIDMIKILYENPSIVAGVKLICEHKMRSNIRN